MSDKQDRLGDFLIKITENYLTKRKRRKLLAKARTQEKGWFMELVASIPSTLLIVFFLNLYFIQAYVIPSGSMRDTLLEQDRILVDKFSYGPEIWIGVDKYFPSIKQIERGQIITFPNPDYQQQGAFFETLRRVLFLSTFTLIDIGKENGQPPVDLLIKRAVGYDGDRLVMRDGNMLIKAEGEAEFLPEEIFKFINNVEYGQNRLFSQEQSELVAALEEYRTYRTAGLPTPAHLQYLQDFVQEYSMYAYRMEAANPLPRARARWMIHAHRQVNLDQYYLQSRGIYVPKGYVLPLGDNRDNSQDGRSFGVVAQKLVQGSVLFRFLPFERIGGVQ